MILLAAVFSSHPVAGEELEKLINRDVIIENKMTKRYVFSDGETIQGKRGDEGGWSRGDFKSPSILGTDANYYNRAIWKIIPFDDCYLIENTVTKRYLFSDGEILKGNRGDECGWSRDGFKSPKVMGADANYYNRALWKIIRNGDTFIIENKETKRYLFSDGNPISGKRESEGGWSREDFHCPSILGTDANYNDQALWKITQTGTEAR